MPTTFRPYEPEQMLLLSPKLQEWLPEGHLAHHVSDLVDGTKVRAKASKRKAMSYGRMREEERRLEAEIEGLLKRAEETDAEEDARFGECMRGASAPCDAPHGEEAGHLGGSQAVRATQMAVGSPTWLDQGSPGIPTIQCPGLGQGARGMGLGVLGAEPQASANPCGCVRESARPGDMANRTHRRPLVRLLEPSPGPCTPLHTPRSRHSCPSSYRIDGRGGRLPTSFGAAGISGPCRKSSGRPSFKTHARPAGRYCLPARHRQTTPRFSGKGVAGGTMG